MEWMYPRIGHRIRRARLRLQFTQAQLGQAVGLTRTSIANIELGRQKIMVHTLFQFAEVLHVSVAQLLPAYEEASPQDQVDAGVLAPDERAFYERAVQPRLEKREL